jgi:hypothetical protein
MQNGSARAWTYDSSLLVYPSIPPANEEGSMFDATPILAYPVGCQSDAFVIMDEDGSPRLSDDASRVSAGFPG